METTVTSSPTVAKLPAVITVPSASIQDRLPEAVEVNVAVISYCPSSPPLQPEAAQQRAIGIL